MLTELNGLLSKREVIIISKESFEISFDIFTTKAANRSIFYPDSIVEKFILNSIKVSAITKLEQSASTFQQNPSARTDEKFWIMIINGAKDQKKNVKHGRQHSTSVLFLIIFQVI